MKCLIVGAGNAGRPVARILNHVGHEVYLTDQKSLEDFPENVQKILEQIEKEGVNLYLGTENHPELSIIDTVYLSPTIPPDAPIVTKLESKKGIKYLENNEISQIIDNEIPIDIIGITGTLGKTSTTHIIAHIFKQSGYKVWLCSSRHGNLLSEVIIEGIVQGMPEKNDIAILELPHGTSRLMSEVKLKIGLLTNIYSEHLCEFEDSMEKYIQRKLFITKSSEILITTPQTKDLIKTRQEDVIFYSLDDPSCQVRGNKDNNKLHIIYRVNKKHVELVTTFNLSGYYIENSLAAAAAALTYGIKPELIKKGLNSFKGIPGHLEYIGDFCGRSVHFDAAFVPEGLTATLNQFPPGKLIILIDNPDSTTIRDKKEIGSILRKYSKTVIVSGYNETTGILDMKAANEVIDGLKNRCLGIAVEDMVAAGIMSIKHSKPGDIILHVGPGAITNYDELKKKMMSGITEGCRKYG